MFNQNWLLRVLFACCVMIHWAQDGAAAELIGISYFGGLSTIDYKTSTYVYVSDTSPLHSGDVGWRGLEYGPGGRLFASGALRDRPGGKLLYQLDIENGVANFFTLDSKYDSEIAFGDLAWDERSNRMFTSIYNDEAGSSELIAIDLHRREVESIGLLPSKILLNGLSFDHRGRLFGFDAGQDFSGRYRSSYWLEIDPTSASILNQVALFEPMGFEASGLHYNASNSTMYLMSNRYIGENHISTVDLDSGEIELVAVIPWGSVGSLGAIASFEGIIPEPSGSVLVLVVLGFQIGQGCLARRAAGGRGRSRQA